MTKIYLSNKASNKVQYVHNPNINLWTEPDL